MNFASKWPKSTVPYSPCRDAEGRPYGFRPGATSDWASNCLDGRLAVVGRSLRLRAVVGRWVVVFGAGKAILSAG